MQFQPSQSTSANPFVHPKRHLTDKKHANQQPVDISQADRPTDRPNDRPMAADLAILASTAAMRRLWWAGQDSIGEDDDGSTCASGAIVETDPCDDDTVRAAVETNLCDDDTVRAAAMKVVRASFHFINYGRFAWDDSVVPALVSADGKPEDFWKAVGDVFVGEIELRDLWAEVCRLRYDRKRRINASYAWEDSRVAACVVASFVRVGLALSLPFERGAADRHQYRPNMKSPLCLAVAHSPALAHALLDLPTEYGLDVNAIDDGAPAIGHTNPGVSRSSSFPTLFGRLLDRTDRAVVTAGIVDVDSDGVLLTTDAATHVLVSNILRCNFDFYSADLPDESQKRWVLWVERAQAMARLFIARAQSDGGGTDLTAGVPHCGRPTKRHRAAHDPLRDEQKIPPSDRVSFLWPNSQFRGALVLVDRLCQFWTSQEPRSRSTSMLIQRLEPIRSEIIAALARIRAYREGIQTAIVLQLVSGNIPLGICARDLAALIAVHLVVPLYDESQLLHPLLDPTNPVHNESQLDKAPLEPAKIVQDILFGPLPHCSPDNGEQRM
jgi:hypothetical protein